MFTSYGGSGGENSRQRDAARTVMHSCVACVTSQQGRVSEVRHWQSLIRRDITTITGPLLIVIIDCTEKLL